MPRPLLLLSPLLQALPPKSKSRALPRRSKQRLLALGRGLPAQERLAAWLATLWVLVRARV